MTLELTHKQAAILRAVDMGVVTNCTALPCGMGELVLALYPDSGRDPHLSTLGAQALVDYDATWQLVSVKEVQALRALRGSLEGLMRESEGVVGLHLNGAVATWDELTDEWLEFEGGGESSPEASRELVTVPREMFKALVDDLRSEVDEHARRYAGYPRQIARRDDDRELIAEAEKLLRG